MPTIKTVKQLLVFLTLALFFIQLSCFGQLKNLGTNAKIKPQPTYFFSVYAYYDLVRETGIGVQYQLLNKYNIDVSAYSIKPTNYFKDKILQWDYYDLKGYGFSLKPKFQLSLLNRFYVGLNLAYEKLYHDKVWVEYYGGKGSELHKDLEKTNGFGYTVGLTLGNKMMYKQYFFEPFFGIGLTSTELDKTVYETDNKNYRAYRTYPYSLKDKFDFFQMNIGLKIGYSFKKSKKHDAIDKKFDAVFIPKLQKLNNYLKTIDTKSSTVNKHLRKAKEMTEGANRSLLRRYKRYYSDTTKMYKKIDEFFNRIDGKIIKGNQ